MPKQPHIQKVLVIGSGPITIGQAAEFDYAGTQACLALKEEQIHVVLVNNNPATIMTDEEVADTLYLEPLTVESVTKIIARERPDGLLATTGGQTGLNLAIALNKAGVLQRYGVQLLGTPIRTIENSEDREMFKNMMEQIGEPVPASIIARDMETALSFAGETGYPLIVRPAYTLGGSGGGIARDEEQLRQIVRRGLKASPIHQVLVEQSIKGWKEIEYEVMRDVNDTCITVCNMENVDPVGIHTGDSVVVAPSQTLTDQQHQMLRSSALKVIRSLGVVGGCNIQFALHPETGEYAIIEVNPRVSRSSALASKVTGYPIARIAAKLSVGLHLDECVNPVTGHTYASFEPAVDYIAVKLPRWPFDKFPQGDRVLGTQMKATGEVMALERTFEAALMKAVRSLDVGQYGLLQPEHEALPDDVLQHRLECADDERLFLLGEAFRRGWSLEDVHRLTDIDPFFLFKLRTLVQTEQQLKQTAWQDVTGEELRKAKRLGFTATHLAGLFGVPAQAVRKRCEQAGFKPGYKCVDTCAAEFVAETPYFYSTWSGTDEVPVDAQGEKVLVAGSGPIRIGQGIEFDYCSVHGVKALKQMGIPSVVVNNNPETVSTDYATADRLYFEPLTADDVVAVARKEQVRGVLLQYGGQTAVKLVAELEAAGLPVLGTCREAIDLVEDRDRFYTLLQQLGIPHIPGVAVQNDHVLLEAAEQLGYPLLLRPSYVIGGQGMHIVHASEQLTALLKREAFAPQAYPLLLDRYLEGTEIEVDAVTDGRDVTIPLLIEHVERAGVHSGDSMAFFPAVDVSKVVQQQIVDYTERIARALPHKGMLNIQFVVWRGRVYVLEVNPRASRTAPVVSKVTGHPVLLWATEVQLGKRLSDVAPLGLLPRPAGCAVKAPVFSTAKLPGVDAAVGPNMQSTGEVIGLGSTAVEAMAKVLPWSVPGYTDGVWDDACGKRVLISIGDSKKEAALPLLKRLAKKGMDLLATPGTAETLRQNGLHVHTCTWAEAREAVKAERVKAVVNIPTRSGEQTRDGFKLRETALQYNVPLFLTLEAVEWSLKVAANRPPDTVYSLKEFYGLSQSTASPV